MGSGSSRGRRRLIEREKAAGFRSAALGRCRLAKPGRRWPTRAPQYLEGSTPPARSLSPAHELEPGFGWTSTRPAGPLESRSPAEAAR